MNVRIALRNEGEMPVLLSIYTPTYSIVLPYHGSDHLSFTDLEHISFSLGLRLDLKAVKSGLLIATWWRLLKAYAYWKQMQGDLCSRWEPSSETQGQIVGTRESLNRRKNMAQKKSKEQPEEPLGTMSYQTSSKRSPLFWLLIWCYMK